MRICYVVLESTFGAHQYSADLANRLAGAGHDVHLVTTPGAPRDRWSQNVTIHTSSRTRIDDPSSTGPRVPTMGQVRFALRAIKPQVVHLCEPRLWNLRLLRTLQTQGIRLVYTAHDLELRDKPGRRLARRLAHRRLLQAAEQVLVHGDTYRQRLLAQGLPPEKMTCTPLLHLFLGSAYVDQVPPASPAVSYEPWALFFGRIEQSKGVTQLITACALMNGAQEETPSVVIAGEGDTSRLWAGPLPDRLELRNRLIQDQEAADLFRRCGLLVLPYLDATQSALVAAAYYFRKPVVVTRTGALPEYVVEGQTGYVVEPGHPSPLARRLDELLADPARLARMGGAGRAWYDAERPREWQTLLGMYERMAA
jgi:glycosyltransferase involved in cell wall biosynthesis